MARNPLDVVKEALGLDRIERIEHYGRHVASTVVPGYFVWSAPRKVEVECPLFCWSVNGRRFSAVIPVTFRRDGRQELRAMQEDLVRIIRQSLPAQPL